MSSSVALVESNIIGTGIFTTTGHLAGALGRPMLVLGIWVVGLLVALAGCLSYAELSVNLLRSGGEYVYLREARGPAANGPLKKALREGRILIFIDESGLSQRPHRCRTWAPRGQTPVLQYNFNWKSLSVAAGLTVWNFYFRVYAGAVKKEQVRDFLQALVRHLRLPLLVVWDRLPANRSRLVQDYIASLQGWIATAYLPPYAPELNSVEYIWAYWKQHELPNVCPQDYWRLTETARRTLRRMRRRPHLITAFWQQASLWPE